MATHRPSQARDEHPGQDSRPDEVREEKDGVRTWSTGPLSHTPALVGPWASHLTFLKLGLLICKMG